MSHSVLSASREASPPSCMSSPRNVQTPGSAGASNMI